MEAESWISGTSASPVGVVSVKSEPFSDSGPVATPTNYELSSSSSFPADRIQIKSSPTHGSGFELCAPGNSSPVRPSLSDLNRIMDATGENAHAALRFCCVQKMAVN